jgi:parallel beta-helix repeat protein
VLFEGGRNNTLIGNRSSNNQDFGFAIKSATNTTKARNRGIDNGLGLFG